MKDRSYQVLIAFISILFCSNISAKEKVSFEFLVPISAHQQKSFDREFKDGGESSYSLLQFWASWCHSCSGFMYDLDKLASDTRAPYFAISTDNEIEKAEKYLSKHPLFKRYDSRYWFDRGAKLKSFYKIDAVPTVVVVDIHGYVVWRTAGHLNSEDLFKLRQLLAQKKTIQKKKEV